MRLARAMFISLVVIVGAFMARAASVQLVWDPSSSSDVSGYALYYGPSSGIYTNRKPTSDTNLTVSGLVTGAHYFFVVTATNSAGLESLPSNEVCWTAPLTNRLIGLPTLRLDRDVSSVTIQTSPDLATWSDACTVPVGIAQQALFVRCKIEP